MLKNILDFLRHQGIDIDTKNIKNIGEYVVDVRLGHGIYAKLKIDVKGV